MPAPFLLEVPLPEIKLGLGQGGRKFCSLPRQSRSLFLQIKDVFWNYLLA